VKRYVLTGAPGAGKTSILRRLRERGWAVVEEAATDVIAREQAIGVSEPWRSGDFIDKIVTVQRERQQQPVPNGVEVQFYDRSPFCTLALARYLGQPATSTLTREIARVARKQLFDRVVFFVRPLGFIVPTAARRISYGDSLKFEAIHEAVYRDHGFEIIDVAAGLVEQRVTAIEARVARETLITW
jgi:predicted ATPase